MIRLVIFKKGIANAQRVINLNVPPQGLLLGRSRTSNVLITDPKVSHNHAVILRYKDGYYIKDIGSKSGTFVNGNKVAVQKLNPGDEIRLGNTTIRFMVARNQPVSNNNAILIPIIASVAVVIFALIIVLPISNYLKMTEKAGKALIETDMKAVSIALEAYNTDWGQYPDVSSWSDLKAELEGIGSGLNSSGHTTATGEAASISYITDATLTSLDTKVGTSGSISYSTTGGDYTFTVTALIGSKTYTFTITPNGTITVTQP